MISELDIHIDETALKVDQLQKVSYGHEAALIGYFEIPYLKQTVEDLKKSTETFLGYYLENELVGVVSYTQDGANNVEICRFIVDPNYFRKGIGAALVKEIEVREPKAKKITVSTAENNHPAIILYEKHGYRLIKKDKVDKDLLIVILQKNLA